MNKQYFRARITISHFDIALTLMVLLGTTPAAFAQKPVFAGYVELLFNDKNEPLHGITIATLDAQDDTDKYGRYELIFPATRKPGERVSLKVHNNSGWQIVDKTLLEQRIPAKKEDVANTIFLCKEKDLDRAQLMRLSNISGFSLRDLRARERDLVRQIEAGYAQQQQMETELTKVRAEKQLLQKINEDLARSNQAGQSSLYVRADNALGRGRPDSALIILDDQVLTSFAARAKSTGNDDLKRQAFQNYVLKGNILVSLGKFKEAIPTLLKAHDLNQKDIDLLIEIATLRLLLNPNLEENIHLFENALRYSDMPQSNATIHSILSILNVPYDADKSAQHARESIKEYRSLALINPDKFNEYLAVAIITQATTAFMNQGGSENSLAILEEAGRIFQKIEKSNPAKYQPYMALLNLQKASLMLTQSLSAEAEKLADSSLAFFTQKYQEDPGYGIVLSFAQLIKALSTRDLGMLDSCAHMMARIETPAFFGISLNDVLIPKDGVPELRVRINNAANFTTMFTIQMQLFAMFMPNLIQKYDLLTKSMDLLEKAYISNEGLYSQLYMSGLIMKTNARFGLAIPDASSIDEEFANSDQALQIGEKLYNENRKSASIINLLATAYSNDAALCLFDLPERRSRGKANIEKSLSLLNTLKKDYKFNVLLLEEHIKGAKQIRKLLDKN